MDFSFILVIAVSAVLASASMILAEVSSRWVSVFRLPFAVSYLLGIIAMQPWRISTGREAGMAAVMMVFMALWVAVGWLIGAGPTAFALKAIKWVSGRTSKRA